MFPGVWANTSQINGPFPSSSQAPSIWYEDVATPQWNPSGNRRSAEAGDPAARAVIGTSPSCRPTLSQPEGPRGAVGGRGGEPGGRDRGLAVGDAAVVGRKALRHEDAQALRGEPLSHALEEPAVLEDAAREHDGARPPLPGHARAGLGRRG